MNNVIYWFSGSGNSLFVAKQIAEVIENAQLKPIAKPGDLTQSIDNLYLVFPIYGFGPPIIVSDFVNSLPMNFAKNAYCIYTYGGNAGGTSKMMKKKLAKKGMPLTASYGIGTVDNYPPLGGAPKGEKLKSKLENEKKQIETLKQQLKSGETGNFEDSMLIFRLLGGIIYALFEMGMKKADKKFWLNPKCTKCGICAKICPVGNIEVDDDGPKWLRNCEQCFACFHWCPEEAIEYGRKSKDQLRYQHPDIKINEMMHD